MMNLIKMYYMHYYENYSLAYYIAFIDRKSPLKINIDDFRIMTEANIFNINSIGYKVSNKEYLDKLRQYEIISLSMNIDLKKYAKVEECEFDIKGLASEIIRLKEMESTTVVRLLIKIYDY